jgi:hypothetical protein
VSSSSDKSAITSLTDIATAFAAFVAIPAVLFYPVGFLSRWLQIYTPYDIKIQTAWHATAVIDKLDVVGQGALVLIPPLVLSILLSILLGNVIYLFKGAPDASQVQRRRSFVGLVLLAEFVVVLLCLLAFKIFSCALLIGAAPRDLEQGGTCLTSDLVISILSILGYSLGCAFGGHLIYRDFDRVSQTKTAPYGRVVRATDRERPLYCLPYIKGRSLSERWILRGLAVAYVVSILAVLLLSPFLEEPSLPRVVYGPENDRKVGLLLSHHADGRWYVLHSDVPPNPQTFEAEGQWDTEMLALPDRAVGDIRFLRADPATVYAHKGASLQNQGIPTHYPGDVIRIELNIRDDASGVRMARVSCHLGEFGPHHHVVEISKEREGTVEKGEVTWVLTRTVTTETAPGVYSCEYITVSDAHGIQKTFSYEDERFRIAEDEEQPDLQEVRISVSRP